MKNKNLILGIALIVLIALAYAYQGPFQKWKDNLGKPKNFLAKVDIDKINKIEIKNNEKETVLEKKEEKWNVNKTKDFYVNKLTMDDALESLKKAVNSDLELASDNKDKKSDFRVDDYGIKVKLYQDEAVLSNFIIGKMTSDYLGTYVTEQASDKTYVVKTNLFSAFNQQEWRDSTIFTSDKEKINMLRMQYPNTQLVIEKHEDEWKGIKPYEFLVNQEKIVAILDLMSDLVAVEIPEQKFEGTKLDKHFIIVQAKGDDNIDNAIMIGGDNGEELYYAKRADSDNIYLITKEQRDELDKRIGDLK
ncbi:DUF4340 domain-containing protein [Patescibacteria group bacterium]|nr:DUF4340 domain-containing protein [Patescibacteria group bacterium]MBU1421285.1 DUF4340 domain-containing protein [Patescibacteria group bacterium]MBU2456894.1 DUF4340 domain-containing protein [Patescibacteria group bacterium]MBU2474867.1 DUF4340 domain-containing protein [Patescibacteria group bacterium]